MTTSAAVSIASPANNAVFGAPATITINASASDADGTVAKVDFFQGATLIGTATAAPYSATAANLTSGSYSFTAVATDNSGAATTSAAVAVRVNAAPTVAITSPASGATYNAPAAIAISASAADADGTIASVAFYHDGVLITTVSAAPYSITWTGVPQGSYVLSAVATDDLGAATTSATVPVTVGPHVAQMYFIHPDHLNTPRSISDQSGNEVWRWDNTEPFGDSVPNDNPSGFGVFDMPLGFAGQYRDREVGTLYNYYRDYDPNLGIYKQSDPIGLRGGLNTYAYVGGNPLAYVDPLGLRVVIVGHVAAGILGGATNPDSFHLALYLDPDDKICECRDVSPMTIGGQFSWGRLVLEFNNPGDSATQIQTVRTPPGMTDCQFIRNLIAAAKRYKPVWYGFPDISPIPGRSDGSMPAGSYNSNSIVSGVISAAGGIPPAVDTMGIVQVPGYSNPVPVPSK
jgi:RHS repeat-associated protein